MSFTNCKIISKQTLPSDYFACFADRGDAGHPVSSSTLREFARCPSRWRGGYVAPESEAKAWGSLLDCLALTPEQFDARYAVQPKTYKNEKGETKPWNNNANACRSWNAEQVGREIVRAKDQRNAESAIRRMVEDELIAAWIKSCDCQVWGAGQWQDDKSGLTIPVKCLIDFVPRADTEFCKCLGDLKTTRTAGVMAWQRDCYRMGYHFQAAFNTDLYVAATGEDRNTWCWILSESYEPWEPGKRMLSQDFITLGREAYTRAIENYCACLKANRWPGYDDNDEAVQSWTLVAPEPWMTGAELFAPRFDFDGAADQPEADNPDIMP